MARPRIRWTEEEDRLLGIAVLASIDNANNTQIDWNNVSSQLPDRSNKDCRKRWHYKISTINEDCPWQPDEEERLRKAVGKFADKWVVVAQAVGTRDAEECSLQWAEIMDAKSDLVSEKSVSTRGSKRSSPVTTSRSPLASQRGRHATVSSTQGRSNHASSSSSLVNNPNTPSSWLGEDHSSNSSSSCQQTGVSSLDNLRNESSSEQSWAQQPTDAMNSQDGDTMMDWAIGPGNQFYMENISFSTNVMDADQSGYNQYMCLGGGRIQGEFEQLPATEHHQRAQDSTCILRGSSCGVNNTSESSLAHPPKPSAMPTPTMTSPSQRSRNDNCNPSTLAAAQTPSNMSISHIEIHLADDIEAPPENSSSGSGKGGSSNRSIKMAEWVVSLLQKAHEEDFSITIKKPKHHRKFNSEGLIIPSSMSSRGFSGS